MTKQWHPIVILAAALLVVGTHAWLDKALDKQLDKKHISSKDWKLPVVDVPTYTLDLTNETLSQYLVTGNGTAQPTASKAKRLGQEDGDVDGHALNPGGNIIDSLPGKNRKMLQSSGTGIEYVGGAVMVDTPNVYMIYVNSQSSSGSADWSWTHWPNYFLRHLGDSYRYKINTRYFNEQKQHVNGTVNLAAAVHVTVPQDFTLDAGSFNSSSWGGLGAVLQSVLYSGDIPLDVDNGIYVVAVAPDSGLTLDSGYCTEYCAFHDQFELPANWLTDMPVNLKIAYMPMGGDLSCSDGCSVTQSQRDSFQAVSPTGSWYMDGFLSGLLHELEETVTDPLPETAPGWLAQVGDGTEENADLCAWTFGKPYFTNVQGKKAIYNAVVGGLPVFVQMGWDRQNQKCIQGIINS